MATDGDTRATQDKGTPTGSGNLPEPPTSQTVGYDSAQKSGYDTAQHAYEARETVNEIESAGRTTGGERAENEQDARADKAGTKAASEAANKTDDVAAHLGSRGRGE